MLELRRILVPYDFSDAAGHAARYACDLASHFGAEVTILHVLPTLEYDFAMTQPFADRRREVNELRMAHARQTLDSFLPRITANGTIRREVVEGDAADEIITVANEGRYDAIVMSTRGAGAFRRWFIIGSVTSKVLHAAEKPVITSVHFENHRSPLPIRQVLCAIDLGPQSAQVLCWAMRAAESFGAKLAAAHAAPAVGDIAASAEDHVWRATARERFAERIELLKKTVQVQAETLIEFGPPAATISELARSRDADLLVLGRGVSQDLLGRLRANAYDIIRQCPCPVVSV